MEKRSFTVTASTGPMDELEDHTLEALAAALDKGRHLKGAAVSGNMLTRTLSVRASIDEPRIADAILAAFEGLNKALGRAGVDDVDFVDFSVAQELPEDEFASARDDVVGTPEVAQRLGVSRQRVAQLVSQPGRFPYPIATVRGTHVWRWGDIADWSAAGARDMRRKQADNTIDLMDALKRKVAREAAPRPRMAAAKRVQR